MFGLSARFGKQIPRVVQIGQTGQLKKKYDNQAAVLDIVEQPFGTLGNRKLKDISQKNKIYSQAQITQIEEYFVNLLGNEGYTFAEVSGNPRRRLRFYADSRRMSAIVLAPDVRD